MCVFIWTAQCFKDYCCCKHRLQVWYRCTEWSNILRYSSIVRFNIFLQYLLTMTALLTCCGDLQIKSFFLVDYLWFLWDASHLSNRSFVSTYIAWYISFGQIMCKFLAIMDLEFFVSVPMTLCLFLLFYFWHKERRIRVLACQQCSFRMQPWVKHLVRTMTFSYSSQV